MCGGLLQLLFQILHLHGHPGGDRLVPCLLFLRGPRYLNVTDHFCFRFRSLCCLDRGLSVVCTRIVCVQVLCLSVACALCLCLSSLAFNRLVHRINTVFVPVFQHFSVEFRVRALDALQPFPAGLQILADKFSILFMALLFLLAALYARHAL